MAHRVLEGLRFDFLDAVDIVAGEHAGHTGSVLGLLTIDDEVRYLIELHSGFDAPVREANLRLRAATSEHGEG